LTVQVISETMILMFQAHVDVLQALVAVLESSVSVLQHFVNLAARRLHVLYLLVLLDHVLLGSNFLPAMELGELHACRAGFLPRGIDLRLHLDPVPRDGCLAVPLQLDRSLLG
jgi:hypothetical protein